MLLKLKKKTKNRLSQSEWTAKRSEVGLDALTNGPIILALEVLTMPEGTVTSVID